ncbi:MAG: thioredoxin family protein [Gemmatimonadaceae bacterium]|nr:thioredoxin family protein [Gemmatimonadaceae bacterium]
MRSLITGALASLAIALSAHAQEHPITFTVRAANANANVRPGARLSVLVSASIPSGWHLYSITQPAGGPVPTSFTVAPRTLFRIEGALGSPVPNLTPDPNFGIITEWYEDSATFRVPVRVAATAGQGAQTLHVIAAYQTCTARYCLPPTEDTLSLALTVAGQAVIAAAAPPSTPPSTTPARQAAPPPAAEASPVSRLPSPVSKTQSNSSLALFLWLAATMGALSLLTPCVFPMVPITVSYFSQRSNESRASTVGSAFLYAGGIVGAFSGLGLGAALVVGVGGLNRFAANPWLNLAIALVFVAFALSLFDVLHIALPSGALNWLDRQARGNRLGRAGTTLLMGATFAVTTLTCTAPFVGTLLVSAAQGDWRWPAAGLVVFSSVLALPFFVLALVPRALAKLPRSGTWMQTMKGALAFIELAAATKFLSNADLVQGWGVFTRNVVLAIWVSLGVMLVLYLVGIRYRTPTSMPAQRYLIPAGMALAVTAWLATGLRGARLGEMESFLPPAGASSSGVSGTNELSWLLNDYSGALEQARHDRRLVLIDFTGYTCTNCRWMEANMFPRLAVRTALDRFVRVRLFTDGKGEPFLRQQRFELQQFKTVALPLYAIVDANGATRATFLGMTRDTNEFTRFLSDAAKLP